MVSIFFRLILPLNTTLAIALPFLRQTFRDQRVAEAFAAPCQNAQLAAVLVLIASVGVGSHGERALVEQLGQSRGGLRAELGFVSAVGLARFGRVDIGDADLVAIEPDRIAIDHAGRPDGAAAGAELRADRIG